MFNENIMSNLWFSIDRSCSLPLSSAIYCFSSSAVIVEHCSSFNDLSCCKHFLHTRSLLLAGSASKECSQVGRDNRASSADRSTAADSAQHSEEQFWWRPWIRCRLRLRSERFWHFHLDLWPRSRLLQHHPAACFPSDQETRHPAHRRWSSEMNNQSRFGETNEMLRLRATLQGLEILICNQEWINERPKGDGKKCLRRYLFVMSRWFMKPLTSIPIIDFWNAWKPFVAA